MPVAVPEKYSCYGRIFLKRKVSVGKFLLKNVSNSCSNILQIVAYQKIFFQKYQIFRFEFKGLTLNKKGKDLCEDVITYHF